MQKAALLGPRAGYPREIPPRCSRCSLVYTDESDLDQCGHELGIELRLIEAGGWMEPPLTPIPLR